MTAIVAGGRLSLTPRRLLPGEIGCVGACPLCAAKTGSFTPPCLACRDELRSRVADMQLSYYAERAVN
jgi:hypothetical protein